MWVVCVAENRATFTLLLKQSKGKSEEQISWMKLAFINIIGIIVPI